MNRYLDFQNVMNFGDTIYGYEMIARWSWNDRWKIVRYKNKDIIKSGVHLDSGLYFKCAYNGYFEAYNDKNGS